MAGIGTALVDWIYSTSPWITTGVFVAAALLAITIVLVPFSRIVRPDYRRRHNELFLFTVTNIAVLYAVLLAFIAVATWEAFSHASGLAEAEANLVGNLYRDTEGLGPDPAAAAMRAALQRYTRTVIDREWPEQQQGNEPEQGWADLEAFQRALLSVEPRGAGQTVVMQEMLRALNELYAARRSRVDASQEHVPAVVWDVIIIVGGLTVGFTFLLGVESLSAHLIASGGFAVALVLVMALIVQLDYPFRGDLSVGPGAYQNVLGNMRTLHPEAFAGATQ